MHHFDSRLSLCIERWFLAFQGTLTARAFQCRANCSQDTGGGPVVTHERLRLHVFVLQNCLGSTGAFPGRVCSVCSSFCASGSPMTDSILMWLSQFNSTDLKEFKERLEINTANCTFARNYTSNRKKRRREKPL